MKKKIVERSWTVADESPGGTETTTILNEIPTNCETIYEDQHA